MRRYLIFVAASLGLLMYSIDSTVVAVAFPNLIKDFATNVLWAAWTISIYLIAVTSVMPLMGNLSDSFGRKKVFLISLILFTASSLACGLAPDIYSLVAFRFLQGIGGASFLPTAAGIVSDQFPENRERAIGLFTSIFPIGGIIGPNLGGWVVSLYQFTYRHWFDSSDSDFARRLGSCLSASYRFCRGFSFLWSDPFPDVWLKSHCGGLFYRLPSFNNGLFSSQFFFPLSIFPPRDKRFQPDLGYNLLEIKAFSGSKFF
jgi:MFS family permease